MNELTTYSKPHVSGSTNKKNLPLIIAGPMVRHCDKSQLNFWLVTTQPVDFCFELYQHTEEKDETHRERSPDKSTAHAHLNEGEHSLKLLFTLTLSASHKDESSLTKDKTNKSSVASVSEHQKVSQLQQIKIGESAYINLITITAQDNLIGSAFNGNSFPENAILSYNINAIANDQQESITEISELLYDNQKLPNLVIKTHIDKLLHGSCRKPHYHGKDGLKQVDNLLNQVKRDVQNKPSMLIMSGDQIYVDEVAGPTLNAIHQVINLLGLHDETWENGNLVTNSQALFEHKYCYYQRQYLLPNNTKKHLFGQKEEPIFTAGNVKNHLITLSEVLAMYLLTWSPTLWEKVKIASPPNNLPDQYQTTYQQELLAINNFHQGLYQVRRAMAHLPVYMIFDDHDVTDDWNLTRGWEEAAYSNAFSKQIIGNALIAYWLCQGWGNAPENFTELLTQQKKYFNLEGYKYRTELVDTLLHFNQWNYNLNTNPKLVVLDTRTQRWRSESNANKPSGLMDWETLSDFQQAIVKQTSVIVVSPAPIYGVKLIETIQRIFTLCGKPLVVDAENWMAHPGTANVILNIFRNTRTPHNFIILSGDVHYSFVYEVTHRFRKSSAKIIQVTCSGIKNTFPEKLLTVLEQLNRVLYSTYSPLNWFTKRRRMKIRVRKPDNTSANHLHNGSGIGILSLNKENDEVITELITAEGKTIEFIQYDADDDL